MNGLQRFMRSDLPRQLLAFRITYYSDDLEDLATLHCGVEPCPMQYEVAGPATELNTWHLPMIEEHQRAAHGLDNIKRWIAPLGAG